MRIISEHFFQKHQKFFLLILIFLGLLAYANALPNQMFWDDEDNILKNAYVQDWHYLGKYFSENLIAGAGLLSNLWRPIVLLSHSIEWRLWKNWAVGYHFTNICLHLANTILVFLLLKQWLKKSFLAWGVAVFFLLHPIQTESVTYVSGRGDVLSSFFVLLGLFFYTIKKSLQSVIHHRRFYFLTIGCYVLALLTKEITIVFPLYLLLGEIFIWQRKSEDKIQSCLDLFFRLLPFFFVGIIYIFLRFTILNFQNTFNFYNKTTLYSNSLWIRILTFLKVIPLYFSLLFWPINLHMERAITLPSSFWEPPVVAGTIILIISLGLIFFCYRRQPKYSLAINWFFIGLIPVSGILVPINSIFCEHWLYLPIIGFGLFGGLLIKNLINKFPKLKCPIVILFILLSICYLILTIDRNRDWRTAITFYENVLHYNPKSLRIWNNLGMAYAQAGKTEKALWAYQQAILLDVNQESAATYHNLANLYQTLGQTDKAVQYYEKALMIDEKFIFSYLPLANAYLNQKRTEKAIEVLKKANKIFPSNEQIKNALLFLKKKETLP